MPDTSVVGQVIAALRAQLVARPGLADVAVLRFAQNPDEYGNRHIVLLASATGSMEFRGFPLSKRQERFTLSGALETRAPGAGDDVAQAALDASQAVLAEIEAQLVADPTVGGTCMTAALVGVRHKPAADDANRYHIIEFDIDVTALLS